MTFGLNSLAVGTIIALTSSLPSWCVPESAPEINVIPTTEDVQYDFEKNSGQLGQFDIAHSPYEPGTPTIVKGLHSGKIQFRTEFQVAWKQNQRNGRMCMFYKQVNVHFHVDPTIYITNDHLPGSCQHDAIHEHEMKHLMTDREVINDYSLWIGEAIHNDFVRNGYIWGPIYENQKDSTMDEMKTSLNDVVRPLIQEMTADRRERQAAIDTIEEYERVAAACKPNKKRRRR